MWKGIQRNSRWLTEQEVLIPVNVFSIMKWQWEDCCPFWDNRNLTAQKRNVIRYWFFIKYFLKIYRNARFLKKKCSPLIPVKKSLKLWSTLVRRNVKWEKVFDALSDVIIDFSFYPLFYQDWNSKLMYYVAFDIIKPQDLPAKFLGAILWQWIFSQV